MKLILALVFALFLSTEVMASGRHNAVRPRGNGGFIRNNCHPVRNYNYRNYNYRTYPNTGWNNLWWNYGYSYPVQPRYYHVWNPQLNRYVYIYDQWYYLPNGVRVFYRN